MQTGKDRIVIKLSITAPEGTVWRNLTSAIVTFRHKDATTATFNNTDCISAETTLTHLTTLPCHGM